jgi:hypothetical protein
MSLKDSLTDDQFFAVYNAPQAAAVFVATASGGVFESITELTGAAKVLDEARKDGGAAYGELVSALFADIAGLTAEQKEDFAFEFYRQDDLAIVRIEVQGMIADALDAVGEMAGIDGFQRLLMDMGRAAASATGGGFLSHDEGPIDDDEREALAELAQMIGLAQ